MTTSQRPPESNTRKEPPIPSDRPSFPTNERVNAVTHGIGLVLSIVGAIVLVARASSHGDSYRILGCTVFAVSLIAVYAASTLSHILLGPNERLFFRSLDQGSIYLLIAGTGTPFALTFLRTGWWLLFFGLMWALALWGFVSKIIFWHRLEGVAIWNYVLLGWMPIAAVPWLLPAVPTVALWWMLIGGLCYTFGTLFLIFDHRHPLLHGGWHLFVVMGSTCHFLTILHYVADCPVGS